MTKLEDLKRDAVIKGIIPTGSVTIIDIKWHGSDVIELTYKDESGKLANELIYRDREPDLEIIKRGRTWSFEADGALFRLASEAYRIRLAHLFDPLLAVHTSVLEPLPHQITAVYGEMLARQPLRFLLADDPGAGKTIMAGLFIKELIIRGDLKRCLICCPGNLVDQWQDELWQRFQLDFKIISNQTFEDSRSGNPFTEYPLVLGRLDHLSRNPDIMARLEQTEWDLIVVDEAHKMSAHFFGDEIKETKRYKLGKLLGSPARTRHFLLMTATPHNGKEEDFQLFLALLDSDRFEGRFRDGVHTVDTSDLMRRLIKEQLVKFDGKPLFPERRAYTVTYKLSDPEARLYAGVTEYVREEMNRADRLKDEGEGRRGNRVGFALTILQRRLASSPEAIYQSLKRRREKLENRLREEQLIKRGKSVHFEDALNLPEFSDEEIEDFEDGTNAEIEALEDEVLEQASTARTIQELKAEIEILEQLEKLANTVRQRKCDKKWEELSNLLQNTPEMYDEQRNRRKLIIFTEHKDTVNYISDRIRALMGRPESVVVIKGGMGREERRKVQEQFTQDKDVQVLVATDAAGEGINLQRAHLLINYDLPWNPNRLEQRFGRIHRIGQTEVCHLWNLVAGETREGEVFYRLLRKIETEREALGGSVFDVLGKVFEGTELRKLLIEAIRYGDQPATKARLNQVMEQALDRKRLKQLIQEEALARNVMNATQLEEIREYMERAAAKRLQPHFIRSFFKAAFQLLGGNMREREPKRFEITHVPAIIRNRDHLLGVGEPVLTRYERVCFDRDQIGLPGKPLATFICPGQPLLDATISLVLERYRELLKKGTILVDPTDFSTDLRVLFYLEHKIQDARLNPDGSRRTVSRQMQFVEYNQQGKVINAGYAPYLNYRPLTAAERKALDAVLAAEWLQQDLEQQIISYTVAHIVPRHLQEVRQNREELIAKTIGAVKDRLTKEINYWDARANELKLQEAAGKINARLNSAKARQRADELQARLQRRLTELNQELQLSPAPPVVLGGALVVPVGLVRSSFSEVLPSQFAKTTRESEYKAMQAILNIEQELGYLPRDVSAERCGYDIESLDPKTGRLRFIEVKGRVVGAETVTVTKNEILTGLNKPDDFILALVEIDGNVATPWYIRRPFKNEPDFSVTSVNFSVRELLRWAESPS